MSWLLNHPIGDRWHETVRHYAELHEKQCLKGCLTPDQLLEIASVLVRAICGEYVERAVDILEQLDVTDFRPKQCLIYLTIGYIRLKEFDLADNCLKSLKEMDPSARQVVELEGCLRQSRLSRRSIPNDISSIRGSDGDVDEVALIYQLNSTITSVKQTY